MLAATITGIAALIRAELLIRRPERQPDSDASDLIGAPGPGTSDTEGSKLTPGGCSRKAEGPHHLVRAL